jgi:glycerol-3-phosphate O-acyltransferase / dihydroxyacetone phosphate acyltransferase
MRRCLGRPACRHMNESKPILYRICRWLLRAALAFYFTRIELFHREKVPASGPLLFASNHPNSLADAFVIGTSVPRKVNFVATVQLFRLRAVRWLLTRCGVIAINRVKDDPRAMRTVAATFEACFSVLERGEAVAIFPEGITQDDPQLKTVKTGAARLALELEQRHAGKLGLRIVPVGLTFSAKDRYRSKALVNFGEPILVAPYLAGYAENRHGAIQALSAELEQRIKSLMIHLPHLERARVFESVKRLYLDRLWVGNTVIQEPVTPQAGALLLTQAIAKYVDGAFENHPARAAEFVRKLDHYEGTLQRLHLSEDVLIHFPDRTRLLEQSLGGTALAILGAPIAVYGWAHRFIPYWLVQQVVKRTAKQPVDRTHVATATVLGGIVFFPAFFALYVFVCFELFGLPAAGWYAASLPVASLAAHYYLKYVQRLGASARTLVVLLKAPAVARRLLALRAELIELIDAERKESVPERAPATGGGR